MNTETTAERYAFCTPGENVYDCARRVFGDTARVAVSQDVPDGARVLGRVAARRTGPSFPVYA